MRKRIAVAALSLPLALALAACASAALPPQARYVAMGSSFAAGPGVTVPADSPSTRCSRSADNYAHQLARRRNLALTDVSCGGATTAHVLGPWNELPAQIDALSPDTALVTITIGGNDIGFIGGLMAASCEGEAAQAAAAMCRGLRARTASGSADARGTEPSEEAWRSLESALERIAAQVRVRAPGARLVFVDYVALLPAGEPCAQTPLSAQAIATARAKAARLSELTARAATKAGARVLRASMLSRGHDACSAQPWATGFVPPAGATDFVPYHPTLAGMTGIAAALDQLLER